ncbi:thioesterase, partial [Mycobacterium sp. ITM-2017-0098]
AAYRKFAVALAACGVDTYIVQYPRRGDRLADPAPATLADLAAEMLDAADWSRLGPLRLFGHCMGALVGFEFARLAE